MLNATYLGGVLELFDLDDNCSLSLAKILYIYEPKYGIAEGAIPKYVVFNETTQIGFEDIYVTNNSIYALFISIGMKLYLRKSVFDWEGIPITKIKTGCSLSNLR